LLLDGEILDALVDQVAQNKEERTFGRLNLLNSQFFRQLSSATCTIINQVLD